MISDSRARGVELSYYPALRALLEDVGNGLRPKVRCVMNIRNHGAGLPDGGLFTADQLRRTRAPKEAAPPAVGTDGTQHSLLGGQKPARGAIEVKAPSVAIDVTAASEQVLGYLEAYRQVLVTNLREFRLLSLDARGAPVVLERYQIAPTEAEFWAAANHPRRTDQEQGERLLEFVKRVLLSGATLASPQDLAWFLASYAREARFLTESAELPALDAVRRSLEEGLGVKFEGPKGEHFFRSTLVQTLFYGLFASWVMWSHDHGPDDGAHFDWKTAAWTLHVPVVQALFTQIATPHLLGSLQLVPVLEQAAAALNRVDRRAFFKRSRDSNSITPSSISTNRSWKRSIPCCAKSWGFGTHRPRSWNTWWRVWTPCCARSWMCPTVWPTRGCMCSTLLRHRRLSGGGAGAHQPDPGRERRRRPLGRRGQEGGHGAGIWVRNLTTFRHRPHATGSVAPKYATPVGGERAGGVFLTNALTGWEKPHGAQQVLALPELEAERDAAERVKRNAHPGDPG